MTFGFAIKLILAGFAAWIALLSVPKSNRLLDPDTKLFGFHGLIEFFCMVTGCRMMPVGAGAMFVMIVLSYLLSNNLVTLSITTATALISLRVWKELVVHNNPDMPD